MSTGPSKKPSSNEIIATRSDYKRGKQDGLAEAVALINEEADKLDPDGEDVVVFRAVAGFLWRIYRRRQV